MQTKLSIKPSVRRSGLCQSPIGDKLLALARLYKFAKNVALKHLRKEIYGATLLLNGRAKHALEHCEFIHRLSVAQSDLVRSLNDSKRRGRG